MASARCTSTPSRVSGPAALLAPPASRYLAGKAAGLPRLLPICAQRTPSRQSPARRARRRLGRMTQPSTPEANKSLIVYGFYRADMFVGDVAEKTDTFGSPTCYAGGANVDLAFGAFTARAGLLNGPFTSGEQW